MSVSERPTKLWLAMTSVFETDPYSARTGLWKSTKIRQLFLFDATKLPAAFLKRRYHSDKRISKILNLRQICLAFQDLAFQVYLSACNETFERYCPAFDLLNFLPICLK